MTSSATCSAVTAVIRKYATCGVSASSIVVVTPIGQRHDTPTPSSRCWIKSHSAKATAACFVTEYGAEPISVSRPAAEAVLVNQRGHSTCLLIK